LVKWSRLASGTDTAGSATSLASGQTTSGIEESGTPSADTLMVCPPGDTTSTEVGLGPKIDLVKIFFPEEEQRDVEVSRPGLSAVTRRRSLSLSRRRFDLSFSRPEPEESDPTNDIDRDQRRDSQILIEKNPISKAGNPQPRSKEVSNRINCIMTEVPIQDSTIY
jgi:hypothetical protein